MAAEAYVIIAAIIGGAISVTTVYLTGNQAAKRETRQFKRDYAKGKIEKLKSAYGALNHLLASLLYIEDSRIDIPGYLKELFESTFDVSTEVTQIASELGKRMRTLSEDPIHDDEWEAELSVFVHRIEQATQDHIEKLERDLLQ